MVKRKRVESALDANGDDAHDGLSLHEPRDGQGGDHRPPWQHELDAQAAAAAAALQRDDGDHVEEEEEEGGGGGRLLLLPVDYEAEEYPDWGLADEQAYERRGGAPAPMQFMQTLAHAAKSDSDACVRHVPIFKAIHRSWASFLTYRRAYELRTRTCVVVASSMSVARRNKELLANGDALLLLPQELLMWQRVFVCVTPDDGDRACPFTFTAETTRLRSGQWVVVVKHGRFFHSHEPDETAMTQATLPSGVHDAEEEEVQTAKLQYVAAQILDELSQWAPHAVALELQSLTAYLSNLRSQRESVVVPPLVITPASTPTDEPATRRSSRRGTASVLTTSPVAKHATTRRKTQETSVNSTVAARHLHNKSEKAVASRSKGKRIAVEKPSNAAATTSTRTTTRSQTSLPVDDRLIPSRQSKRLRAEEAESLLSRSKRTEEAVTRPLRQGTTQDTILNPRVDSRADRSGAHKPSTGKHSVSAAAVERDTTNLPAAARTRRVSRHATPAATRDKASSGIPSTSIKSPSKVVAKQLRRLEQNVAVTLAEYLEIDKVCRQAIHVEMDLEDTLDVAEADQASANDRAATASRAAKQKAMRPLEMGTRSMPEPERDHSPRRTRRLSVDAKANKETAASPSRAVASEPTRRSLRSPSPHKHPTAKNRTSSKPISTSLDTIRQSPRKQPPSASGERHTTVKRSASGLQLQPAKPMGNTRNNATLAKIPTHKARSSEPHRKVQAPKTAELFTSPALTKKLPQGSSQSRNPLRAWLSPSPKKPKPAKTNTAVRMLKVVTVKKSKAAMKTGGTTISMQIVIPRISPQGQATDPTLNVAHGNDLDDDADWDVVLVGNASAADTTAA